jgi:translocation and assembly module TamB
VHLKGSLPTPELNFSISLPDEYQNADQGLVALRLQQINASPSDVNVQAVSLLILGTFDLTNLSNIIQGQSGTNALISNALNQFAIQEIKFVNVHFDLESYDNYGENNPQDARTELKTDVSRNFFDDRFVAKAGAGIVLQGDPKEQIQKGFNRVTPTFNFQYILNKERTLSIKVFQKDDYKGLIEGKVISTGGGIMFQKDYDSIFKKNKK